MNDVAELAAAHPWATQHYVELPALFPNKEQFAAVIDDLVFAGRLDLVPDAKGLLVLLYATVGAPGVRPIFQNTAFGRLVDYNTLVISDPSLLQDPDIDTGIFLGREATDPIDGVVALARAVARSRRIPDEKIVFFGNSSGGFAAIMAAAKAGLRAIAINAPLDLTAMGQHAAAMRLLANFRPGITPGQLGEEAKERSIAAEALKAAAAAGRTPRVAVFQNVLDSYHLDEHFAPFCAALGVSPSTACQADGPVSATPLDFPEGHKVPPAVREAVLKDGLRCLMD